jgi:iron complex outermembrane receptor protein
VLTADTAAERRGRRRRGALRRGDRERGALYRLARPLSLVVNVARGFRAPAAPDLFANGFHEGTRAFERGNPDLRVETSLNADLGVRVAASRVTGEATVFSNAVRDYIYLRPFGTGAAFDSLEVVQGDARLRGFEARAAVRPAGLAHRAGVRRLRARPEHGGRRAAHLRTTLPGTLRVRLERERAGRLLRTPYLTIAARPTRARRASTRATWAHPATPPPRSGAASPTSPRAARSPSTSRPATSSTPTTATSSAATKEFALSPGRSLVLRVTAGR